MAEVPHVLLQSDPDARETQEWLEALNAVMSVEGNERAHYLIERLIDTAREAGVEIPYSATTAYLTTLLACLGVGAAIYALVVAAAYVTQAAIIFRTAEKLKEVRAPVIVIHGTRDDYIRF